MAHPQTPAGNYVIHSHTTAGGNLVAVVVTPEGRKLTVHVPHAYSYLEGVDVAVAAALSSPRSRARPG